MPHIVVGKPMSDLCWTCQQNSNIILKAVNKSTEEKSAVSNTIISSLYKFIRVRTRYVSKIINFLFMQLLSHNIIVLH